MQANYNSSSIICKAILIMVMTVLLIGNPFGPSICEHIFSSLQEGNHSKTQTLLEHLEESVSLPCVLELFPRYFWAQNMSHILVKFQFVNSADTSACQRVLSTKKIVEHNRIGLSLICQQSSFLIRYQISVTTLMPLNFYHAVWREADQNTLILQCLKSPNPYFWKTLYLPSQQPLRKPKVWWKMVQKYMENTKKFIYDLQVEEQEHDISSYVRTTRKGNKKKHNEYQPFSKKYFYCNQNNLFELGSWI